MEKRGVSTKSAFCTLIFCSLIFGLAVVLGSSGTSGEALNLAAVTGNNVSFTAPQFSPPEARLSWFGAHFQMPTVAGENSLQFRQQFNDMSSPPGAEWMLLNVTLTKAGPNNITLVRCFGAMSGQLNATLLNSTNQLCSTGSCNTLNTTATCAGRAVNYFYNSSTNALEMVWEMDSGFIQSDNIPSNVIPTIGATTVASLTLDGSRLESGYSVEINGSGNAGGNTSIAIVSSLISGSATLNISGGRSSWFDFSTGQVEGLTPDINVTSSLIKAFSNYMTKDIASNLNDIFSAPPFSDSFVQWGASKVPAAGRVYIVYTTESRYARFKIDGLSATQMNITYDYQSANIPNFGGGISGGFENRDPCYDYSNQTACYNSKQSGSNCVWDFAQSKCKQEQFSDFFDGGTGGFQAQGNFMKQGCFIFNSRLNVCQNQTTTCNISGGAPYVCQDYTAAPAGGKTPINSTVGFQCKDITNQTVCDTLTLMVGIPQTLCSWNSSGGNNCYANSTKQMGAIQGFNDVQNRRCEDAGTNQTMCDSFISYGAPCKFSSNKCTPQFDSIFSTGKGTFDAINDETKCKFAGGNWVSKSYIDTTGVLRSNDVCEFGFSKDSCDTNCKSCEKNGTTAWSSLSVARTQCEDTNRTAGASNLVCEFQTAGGNQMPDGKWGFCFPAKSFQFSGGGGGDCSKTCMGCFTNSTCSATAANCTWIPNQFGFDMDGGGFNAQKDGFCESKAFETFKNNNCESLSYSQSTCQASNLNCTWIGTAANATVKFGSDNGFRGCVPAGSTPELCMIPGDEDNDGLSDCADTNSCAQHPACGFGFDFGQGVNFESPIKMGLGANCFQWDGTNQTACETFNGNSTLNGSCVWKTMITSTGTRGLCDPAFERFMAKGMAIDTPPTILGADAQGDAGNQTWLDIRDVGIHDSPKGLDIGSAMNLTDFAGCNKAYTNSQNRTGKYYRFLDVDGNSTGGCVATLANLSNVTGFDYRIDYAHNGTAEVKMGFQCVSGAWVLKSDAQITPITDMCYQSFLAQGAFGPQGVTGVQVLIVKKSDIGNPKTTNVRLMMSSANSTTSWTNPVDSAGPFYYTPGTIDFKFEDCTAVGSDLDGDGFTAEDDPDCQTFIQQGYIEMEKGPACKDGFDNDGNGLTDCNDGSCKYDPFFCASTGFTFGAPDTGDKTAPSLKFTNVNTFPDMGVISYTSSEPTNGSIRFYRNDSTCAQINTTITDAALRDSNPVNDFKPWHNSKIDSTEIGYSLQTNATYYYKIATCDPAGNCAYSGCSNFTTKASTNSSDCPSCSFVLKLDLPSNVTVSLDYDRDGNFTDDVENNTMTYGVLMNYTQGKNISVRLNSNTQNWSVQLDGVNLVKAPTSLAANFSTSMLYNTTTNMTATGMKTDQWERFAQYFGGVETIKLTVPSNGTVLAYCSETNLSQCATANATRVSDTTNTSTWSVPVGALSGFSLYGVQAPASSGSSGSSGTGSSGGGGGGGSSTTNTTTSSTATKQAMAATVKANVAATLKFTKTEIQVKEVVLTLTSDRTAAKITVEKLSAQPATTTALTGTSIGFLSLEKSGFENSDIASAKISFEVAKADLEAKSVKPEDVALYRFTTQWDELATTSEGLNGTVYKFTALTPGFSYFAIASKTAPATTEKVEANATTEPEQKVEAPPTEEKAPEPAKTSSGWLWAVLVLLIIVAAAFILKKKK